MPGMSLQEFIDHHNLGERFHELAEISVTSLAARRMVMDSQSKPGERPRPVVVKNNVDLFANYWMELYLERAPKTGDLGMTVEIICGPRISETAAAQGYSRNHHEYPKAIVCTHNTTIPRDGIADHVQAVEQIAALAFKLYVDNVTVNQHNR